MSTFFEKLVAAVRFLGHYLWIALKALGRFLLWLGALLVRSLSNLITWIRLNLPPRVQFILLAVVVAILIVLVALIFTGHGCSTAPSPNEPAEEQPPEVTYTPDEADFRQISIQPDTITSFRSSKTATRCMPAFQRTRIAPSLKTFPSLKPTTKTWAF